MTIATVSDVGERALIERIIARLAIPSWVVVGPGDDAAVVEPERGALDVLTTDVQVEGVHFDTRFVPPEAIGHRALAVNLSDLAAMGARPRAALLSLILPDDLDVTVVDRLLEGVLTVAEAHGVAGIGGTIARSPGPLVVDVTVTGTAKRRRVLTRGTARPGDAVYVTGAVGDALVGLESLRGGGSAGLATQERRYLHPEPRVRAGVLLARNRAASACIDLSDGLADGVRQIAEASRAGMTIDGDALPIAPAVRRWHEDRGRDPVPAVLRGGDDYELLFTVRPAHRGRLRAITRMLGDLPMTCIGTMTKQQTVAIRTERGEYPLPEGFEHFR